MPPDLLEGVALVTGGGRGIGASIACELADAGMTVAVTGRTPETVESVAAEIGGTALLGDVSRADDVERWVETVERELGPIELLVCNAGISGSGKPFLEETKYTFTIPMDRDDLRGIRRREVPRGDPSVG